jgi:hypothetical protein
VPEHIDDLERQLAELGRHLAVPPAPDLVYGVKQRIAAEQTDGGLPARQPASTWLPWWRRSRVVQAATALVLVFAVLLLASPQVRAAVADVLRVAGLDIHREPAPMQPKPGQLPTLPGERVVSLDEARKAADFDIQVPAALGPPDEVRLADGEPPRVVTLAYRAAPGRPDPDPATQVAVRIDEFAGTISPIYEKYGAEDAEPLLVGGALAIWVPHPHTLVYVDRSGHIRQEAARMAAQTLIWQVGTTTLRMEGELTKSDAIAIARSTIP